MKDFILFQTGHLGNDAPIYSMTNREILFYKLIYIPPYEDLRDLLCGLQIKERKENIFGDNITLVLDTTEWLGKEDDEYFTIIIRFLSDMSNRWNYIFTVNSKKSECMDSLFCFLRLYMQGDLYKDTKWESKNSLETHLTKSLNYSHSAASIIAGLFQHPKMEKIRTNDLIEKITQEILILSTDANTMISDKDVKRYIKSQNNIINLILGEDGLKIIREITKEGICA